MTDSMRERVAAAIYEDDPNTLARGAWGDLTDADSIGRVVRRRFLVMADAAIAAMAGGVDDDTIEGAATFVGVEGVRYYREAAVRALLAQQTAANHAEIERLRACCTEHQDQIADAAAYQAQAIARIERYEADLAAAREQVERVEAMCQPSEPSSTYWKGDPTDSWYFNRHQGKEDLKESIRAALSGDGG